MTEKMIPTTGYVAWFCGPDDYDIFSLPIIGVIPHLRGYEGGEPELEYEPCVINRSGQVMELIDVGRMSGYFLGGFLVGVTPTDMDCPTALEWFSRFQVPVDPHRLGQGDDEEMGSLIVRAQRQARGQYTWPRLHEPARP